MKYIVYELQKWNENEEMIVAVNAIYAITKKPENKSWIFFCKYDHVFIFKTILASKMQFSCHCFGFESQC